MNIDMGTLVWVVRALMLAVFSLPLVIGGILVAIRDKRRA